MLEIVKVLGAAVTLFVTTADDAVWLVPYLVSPRLPRGAFALHSAVFVCVLQVSTSVAVSL